MFLYHIYDWSRFSFAPLNWAAKAIQNSLHHTPFSPFIKGSVLEANVGLLERLTRFYEKPAFNLRTVKHQGVTIEITEKIAATLPFCRLIHFERTPNNANDQKVLIIAPMAGNHATLIRSTVETFLPEHDVYVTDWLDARNIPVIKGTFGVDDYIDYLMAFMRQLGSDAHAIAVCQPAPLLVAAVALLAEDNDPCQPRSMTLIGGPVDAHSVPTLLSSLSISESMDWFEANCVHLVPPYYRGAQRLVHPGFMQLQGFMAMHPDRHLKAQVSLFEDLVRGDEESVHHHDAFYDEYLATMDIPAEFYLQTIDRIFKNNLLPKGQFKWRGRLVDPSHIKKTALLTIEGEMDDLSPPGQTRKAHDLCCSIPPEKKKAHLEIGVGHFGIFNGRKWQKNVYPVLRDFLRSV